MSWRRRALPPTTRIPRPWISCGATRAGTSRASSTNPSSPTSSRPARQGSFRTFLADYVTTEDGTGIVHTAPGFGEDDYQTLKGTGIPTVCPVDAECRFTEEVPDFEGVFVKDADKPIIERLKAEGKLVKREQYLHAYPHCWRCESPLIYRAVGSWFVKIDPVKPMMLDANARSPLGARPHPDRPFRQVAGERPGLGHQPQPLLGQPAARSGSATTARRTVCVGSREELEELSGAEPTTCTSTSWTTSPGSAPAGARCAAYPKSWTAGSNPAPCPTPRSTIPSRTRSISRPTSRRTSSARAWTRPAAGSTP